MPSGRPFSARRKETSCSSSRSDNPRGRISGSRWGFGRPPPVVELRHVPERRQAAVVHVGWRSPPVPGRSGIPPSRPAPAPTGHRPRIDRPGCCRTGGSARSWPGHGRGCAARALRGTRRRRRSGTSRLPAVAPPQSSARGPGGRAPHLSPGGRPEGSLPEAGKPLSLHEARGAASVHGYLVDRASGRRRTLLLVRLDPEHVASVGCEGHGPVTGEGPAVRSRLVDQPGRAAIGGHDPDSAGAVRR